MQKDSIVIKYPKAGSQIYSGMFADGKFPLLLPYGEEWETDTIKASTIEQLGPLDAFGNKGVLHCGLKGSINATLLSDSVQYESKLYADYSYTHVFMGNSRVTFWSPGTGPIRYGWIWDQVSETRCVITFMGSDYKRQFSRIYTLNSLTIDWVALKATCTYTLDYVPCDPAFNYVRSTATQTEWCRLSLLGTYGSIDNVKLSTIRGIVTSNMPLLDDIPSTIIPDDIGTDFIDSINIPQINNLENLKDLKKIKEMLPPILALLKKRNLKTMADFWLWYKYSYKTTELDVREFIRVLSFSMQQPKDSIAKWGKRYSGSTTIKGQNLSCTSHYLVYYKPVSWGILQTLGLDFNCTNLWDLVPFSFVADWFENLGDIFSQLDSYARLTRVPISSVLMTTKSVGTLDSPRLKQLLPMSNIDIFYFRRNQRSTLPIKPICLSLKNPSNHILDGGALYISIKKK